jgi:hypothetical protein
LLNEAGASDGSGQKQREPTSNSSPRTRIWYTGVIQFVPQRSYRVLNSSLSFGYPTHPSGFCIISLIWEISSRAHSCASTRPCRMNPEVLSSCLCDHGIRTFIAVDAVGEFFSTVLFGCCNNRNCRVIKYFCWVCNQRSRWE